MLRKSWGVVGVVACVVLAHMLDATQLHIHVSFYATVWGYPKIGVPQNGGCIMENPIKMDDLGVPLFSETAVCARTVRIMHRWGGGWGGVDVVACVVLTHMLDATQLHIHVSCYATVCARTVRIMHGWGGGWGGRGCMRCLDTHVGCYATARTCFMLRNCTCSYCSYHARIGGVGVVACVVLANMLDATQLHIHVSFHACGSLRSVLVLRHTSGQDVT